MIKKIGSVPLIISLIMLPHNILSEAVQSPKPVVEPAQLQENIQNLQQSLSKALVAQENEQRTLALEKEIEELQAQLHEARKCDPRMKSCLTKFKKSQTQLEAERKRNSACKKSTKKLEKK